MEKNKPSIQWIPPPKEGERVWIYCALTAGIPTVPVLFTGLAVGFLRSSFQVARGTSGIDRSKWIFFRSGLHIFRSTIGTGKVFAKFPFFVVFTYCYLEKYFQNQTDVNIQLASCFGAGFAFTNKGFAGSMISCTVMTVLTRVGEKVFRLHQEGSLVLPRLEQKEDGRSGRSNENGRRH